MDLIKETATKLIKEKKKLRTLQTKLDAQKKITDELSETMLDLMHSAGTTAYKNSQASISIMTSNVPNVENWEEFYGYILANNAFDLLQRRVSATAWRDRIEDNPVPGVVAFTKHTLRIKL